MLVLCMDSISALNAQDSHFSFALCISVSLRVEKHSVGGSREGMELPS